VPNAERPLAVVTGATAGIGRVFCEKLAARGHDLLLVARDRARLEATAAELSAAHGVAARVHDADLGDAAATEALAEALGAEARVDVLVNNAGFGTKGTLARTDAAAQQRLVRVHCLAPLRLAQAVLPGMVARRAGAIVNVASVASFITVPGTVTYSAAKGFLRMLSDGMAAELAGTGVKVQALCPGWTRTEFHGRMGGGREGIPAWAWLSSDDVVDASLRALDRGGPVVVVPDARYKALVSAVRLLPLRALQWVERRAPMRRSRT
jgi:short-subunit dehydrogenase